MNSRAAARSPVPARQTVSQLEREAAALLRRLAPQLDAKREARELVTGVVDEQPSWAVLRSAQEVADPVRERVLHAAGRRAAGAPLAYAVGRAWFRHLTLEVDERVLIPRPETEVLVDLVLQWSAGEAPGQRVVDVGTGSGAIALSLALEAADRLAGVIATDVSGDALAVAARNIERHRSRLAVRVELREGSLLAPVAGLTVDAVVSNPPYIAGSEAAALPDDVRNWEPPVALLGGADGMLVVRPLVEQAAGILRAGGLLALEVDARRAHEVAALVSADARYERVDVRKDLTGRERFVLARRTEA